MSDRYEIGDRIAELGDEIELLLQDLSDVPSWLRERNEIHLRGIRKELHIAAMSFTYDEAINVNGVER